MQPWQEHLAQNGVLLYVPRNVKIETPLHSLIWGAGGNDANIWHVMVYLEEGLHVPLMCMRWLQRQLNGQSFQASNIEIYVGRKC